MATVTHVRGLDSALLRRAKELNPGKTSGEILNSALEALTGGRDPLVILPPANTHTPLRDLVQHVDADLSAASIADRRRR